MEISFKEYLNEIALKHGNSSHYSWKDKNGNLISLNFNYDRKDQILHISANFNNDNSLKSLYNREIDNDPMNMIKTMKYVIFEANSIPDKHFQIGFKESIPMIGGAVAVASRDIRGAGGLPYRNRHWNMTFLDVDRD